MSATPRSEQPAGCLVVGGTIVLIAIALAVPAFVQTAVVQAVWFSDLSKTPYTAQQALWYSYLHPAILVVLAFGLLMPGRRQRAVVLTLLAATGCAALLLIPRVVLPPDAVYGAAFARLAITVLCALPLLWLALRRGAHLRGPGAAAALLLAAPFAVPWVRLGALGDQVDTLLALLQGGALGLLAAGLFGAFLLPALRESPESRGWNLALGGLTMAAALVGIGGAFGQDDIQALMMPVLAAAAFPFAALALPSREGRGGLLAPALVAALIAALPLAFADPEEISLMVALSDDTYKFTQSAAFWNFLTGLLLCPILLLLAGRLPRLGPLPAVAGVAALLWAGTGALYASGGQTGLHGNHFFVVLSEQADLSQAAQIGDLAERRRFVYTTLVDTADRTQAGLLALLDQRGTAYTRFYLVNAIEVNGDLLLREEIARRPEVDRIIFSQNLRPLPQPLPLDEGQPRSDSEPAWGVAAIGADRVWDELNVRGEGITVGQSDSGVDWTHPVLRDAYRGNDGQHDYNWFDPWTGRGEPWDGNGHGTHTIGSVLGADGIGVAPGAQWFGCANLVRNIGNPPDYLHCMQFMLAPFPLGGDPLHDGDPARAADISTNSWGCPPIEGCDQESLLPATRALRAAGIFFVVAAGNEGPACDSLQTPPGNYASAFSVGAIDFSGDLAGFSSRGPVTLSADGRSGPTVLAPGVDVLSAWPGGGYSSASGTSMAAPHVAGVVALIWSANPALRGDIDATEQILIETSSPYLGLLKGCGTPADPTATEGGTLLPDPESGYGVVDAYAAVQRALAFKGR
jgi:hypothetical protein